MKFDIVIRSAIKGDQPVYWFVIKTEGIVVATGEPLAVKNHVRMLVESLAVAVGAGEVHMDDQTVSSDMRRVLADDVAAPAGSGVVVTFPAPSPEAHEHLKSDLELAGYTIKNA